MLPLSLLKTAQGHPMLVELKNGETYNGHLVSCDTWMNIHLREVICTSKDGDRFWRMPECYIRGNTIKYLRVPDEVIDKVQDEIGGLHKAGVGGAVEGQRKEHMMVDEVVVVGEEVGVIPKRALVEEGVEERGEGGGDEGVGEVDEVVARMTVVVEVDGEGEDSSPVDGIIISPSTERNVLLTDTDTASGLKWVDPGLLFDIMRYSLTLTWVDKFYLSEK
eukprot:jgi/Mesen1/2017/ME000148S01120